MTDPFIDKLPPKLANDPELAPFFNRLTKVLHDLTARTYPKATTLEEVIAAIEYHGLTKSE